MKIVTANQMRQIDQQTIEQIGIPGAVLMEIAARAVTDAIEAHFPDSRKVGIFVGKGNNGGDGLAIARQLAHKGRSVQIFLVSPPAQFAGDALKNLKAAQNLSLPIQQILSETDLNQMENRIASCDLIVDAIFGTGLRGKVEGYRANIIEKINTNGCPLVAVDLPSGLEADTGRADGACIRADYTVTIGLPKRGLLLYPGAEMAGKLEVADIGFPQRVIDAQNIQVNWTRPEDAAAWIPTRPAYSHKGTYGRVFVVAGSTGMTGAAALASEGALRVGAGLTSLGIPKSLNTIMEVKLTEVMTLPLPETPEGSLALASKPQILEFVERTKSVLAIGPGLSQHPETVELVHSLVRENRTPMVIDADGLNALAKAKANGLVARCTAKENGLEARCTAEANGLESRCTEDNGLEARCTAEENGLVARCTDEIVLTPHPGEMSRLIGGSTADVEFDRIGVAQRFAQAHQVTLVLKGAPTVIANRNGEVWLNSTGNPGMATGGMGDVLTGIIAGLIAQGMSSDRAAVLGVYLHGLAADIVAKSLGTHGLMAGDVLNAVPQAIETCYGKRES